MVKSKVIIVGDGNIGKTCLLSRFTNSITDWDDAVDWDDADGGPEPTAGVNNYNLTWGTETDDGESKSLDLELWDTSGRHGDYQYRALCAYPGADIYLIAYGCNDSISLRNLSSVFIEEITRCREENGGKGEPWVILMDICTDIHRIEGEAEMDMANTINACAHVRTSAKMPDKAENGVEELENIIKSLAVMKANDGSQIKKESQIKKDAPCCVIS